MFKTHLHTTVQHFRQAGWWENTCFLDSCNCSSMFDAEVGVWLLFTDGIHIPEMCSGTLFYRNVAGLYMISIQKVENGTVLLHLFTTMPFRHSCSWTPLNCVFNFGFDTWMSTCIQPMLFLPNILLISGISGPLLMKLSRSPFFNIFVLQASTAWQSVEGDIL